MLGEGTITLPREIEKKTKKIFFGKQLILTLIEKKTFYVPLEASRGVVIINDKRDKE